MFQMELQNGSISLKEPCPKNPIPTKIGSNLCGCFTYPLKLQALGKLIFYRHIAHVTPKKLVKVVFLRGKFKEPCPKNHEKTPGAEAPDGGLPACLGLLLALGPRACKASEERGTRGGEARPVRFGPGGVQCWKTTPTKKSRGSEKKG